MEFSIENIKGNTISTENGKSVRILCCDRKKKGSEIVALVNNGTEEQLLCYSTNGIWVDNPNDNSYNLVINKTTVNKWINVYDDGTTSKYFNTQEEAKSENTNKRIVTTITVTAPISITPVVTTPNKIKKIFNWLFDKISFPWVVLLISIALLALNLYGMLLPEGKDNPFTLTHYIVFLALSCLGLLYFAYDKSHS